ncbi:Thioredoxin [Paraoerskovia marina]|uniref:Thioredoxin n=1 Tax=Paraoerskovia marina TaxID=545619 RepID=A0A1H1PRD0_9CELL|nr:thioredoxin family protein [Paraoerskovia marina]SDS13822.1 Thioredoxin [Paraoerskovia marina]
MTDNLWMLLAVLALSVVVGVWWRSRQGVVRTSDTGPAQRAGAAPWAHLGLPHDRIVLMQMSAEICSACRQTARVLSEVAAADEGVVHVELDVAEHRDLAAALRVLRTPTVVVVGTDGTEVVRASGAMTPTQAREAVARARAEISTPAQNTGAER